MTQGQTVSAAGLRDGYSLGLGTAGPEEDEPAGRTEVRVVGGTGAGTVKSRTYYVLRALRDQLLPGAS